MQKTIIFISSHSMSIEAFMLPHIRALQSMHNVRVVANTKNCNLLKKHGIDVTIEYAPVAREISLANDFRALWVLYNKFKLKGIDAVHTITPKAGLIGMTAAFFAGVPVRVHSFTGQVWVTRRGPLRWILKAADWITAVMATDVLVDSPSQRSFLIEEKIIKKERSSVLGAGSICGVDVKRFSPNAITRRKIRNDMGTAEKTTVFLFLGRLNKDKGVLDLAFAFKEATKNYNKAELWIVGPDEGGWYSKMKAILGVCIDQVKRVDFTTHPECYMQAADIFCLPSYREGFGSSVIEAASCGLPALVSRIYGLTDAVVEGETGWMHSAGNVPDLTSKINFLMTKPFEIEKMGEAAKKYVSNNFDEKIITNEMKIFYKNKFYETNN